MPEPERGSVLLLMPAAVLVFLVLGGLCLDHGAVFAARRQLEDAASAAANDAATRALDLDRLYQGQAAVVLGPDAERVVRSSVAGKGLDRLDPEIVDVSLAPDGVTLSVTVRGWVPYLFGRALPGRREGMTVEATAVARADRAAG